MEKSAAVSFTSTQFAIEPHEDEDTGPGIYGRALARWLAEALVSRGVAIKEVLAEDWGLCVVTQTRPVGVNVAVANVEGSSTRWQMFAFVERGLFQLARSPAELQQALATMREHLAAIVATIADVRDVLWEELD
jgi:uncharacterized oligopeptide transporter (OPT) family protein